MATKKKLPDKSVPLELLWFRRAFERAGMSQNEVAARIGLDRSAFSRTLKGLRRLQIAETKQLASVLGVSQEDILRHAGGKTASFKLGSSSAEILSTTRAPLAGNVDALTGVATLQAALPHASVLALAIVGDAYLASHQLLIQGDLTAPGSAAKDMGVLQLDDGRMIVGKFKPGFTVGRFDVGPVLGFGTRLDDVAIVGLYELVGMVLEKV
jgi:transcriptional regulator with XRE-family HTH domain